MIKIVRRSRLLEMSAMVGIEPASEGLARAATLGAVTTAEGLAGLTRLPVWNEIEIVFDATSAAAHRMHNDTVMAAGKTLIDLTPAALGPYVIHEVHGDAHLESQNVNMVTCGGQATIPIVAAVSKIARVHYGEIVSSIASLSAGPGTRANIDEFTQTTARGVEQLGGAELGKAIIILNPAEPPVMMRGTVYTLSSGATGAAEPVLSQRSINLIAQLALTPKWPAASRRDPPPSTNLMIRSRTGGILRSSEQIHRLTYRPISGDQFFRSTATVVSQYS
jgi:acetaldehyde dehydrogenase